jgi:hypothetical protein
MQQCIDFIHDIIQVCIKIVQVVSLVMSHTVYKFDTLPKCLPHVAGS